MVFHSPLKAFSLFGARCVRNNGVLYYRVAQRYPGAKEYFPFSIDASQDMLGAELLLCENYQLLCFIAVIPV